MRVLVLALVLAASAASAAEPRKKDYDTPADWLKQPDPMGLWALMPAGAVRKGVSGLAVIECEVAPLGTLEGCRLVSEKPAGLGFGQAALLAAPSLAMKPALKDGRPVASTVRIPLRFVNPSAQLGVFVTDLTIVREPVWEAAPSFADMAAAWPDRSNADAAHISMRCEIGAGGSLKRCRIASQTSDDQSFAAAALALAPKFRLRMTPDSAEQLSKAIVNVPMHFTRPGRETPRTVVDPRWITSLDPEKVQALFPAKAADAGVRSGRGFADCAVAADGRLVDCKPAGAEPDGLGFAEAAVQVASIMQMNPWTDGGGPVDGVRIRLPVKLDLAPKPTPAKP
jgi:TonB family protein